MERPLILAGTDDGLRVVGDDESVTGAGHEMLQAVPANGEMWAISDGSTVWRGRSDGEGRSVATIADGRVNCVLPLGERVLVGGSSASLYELVADRLVRSAAFNAAPGRRDWYTPWGGPPDVRSMSVGREGNIYVNVHVGGVLRSADAGASWDETMDIHADVHQVVADPNAPGTAFAATARGLATTSDGGDSWVFHAAGLHGTYCRAVATSAEYVFISASLGSNGRQAAVYRIPCGGGEYERCTAGLPDWFSNNVDTFCLVAAGSVVAAGDPNGTVYLSRDEGATWDVVASGLPGLHCLALV